MSFGLGGWDWDWDWDWEWEWEWESVCDSLRLDFHMDITHTNQHFSLFKPEDIALNSEK